MLIRHQTTAPLAVVMLSLLALGLPPCVAKKQGAGIEEMADKPLRAHEAELLDLAFDAASAYPLVPHIKNRSRAQEKVVAACLELDQPARALRCIEQIKNWRRGAGYVALAQYLVRCGRSEWAPQYLEMAERISAAEGIDETWVNTIREGIARTYAGMGRTDQADRVAGELLGMDAQKAPFLRAIRGDEDTFDEQVGALDDLLATRHYDLWKYALQEYADLYDRAYGAAERRSLIEQRVDQKLEAVPPFLRLHVLVQMAEGALNHRDANHARELVNRAQAVPDGFRWEPQMRVVYIANLAQLRFESGDEQRARADLGAAVALFRAQKDQIVNYERAGALRPMAEAYAVMGDVDSSLEIYEEAIEQGVINPNIRPRIDDLTATCVSMALHRAEPTGDFWARMRRILEGLQRR